MDELRALLDKILEKKDLNEEEAFRAFVALSGNPELPEPLAAALLTALRAKGESACELVGGAKAMLSTARAFPRPDGTLLDIVGTGGDGKLTLNVSTLASLVVAACGARVAKHGNRSVSSRCGSADLLERLGFPLELSPNEAAARLQSTGFTFLFAPFYHAGFRKVSEIRKMLGFRTIFNLIGPLANPARPSVMLLGVAKPEWLERMSSALVSLGCEKAWVVHGGGGSDELDLEGENQVVSVEQGKIRRLSVKASDAGLEVVSLSSVAGGTPEENADFSRRVLRGEKGALHDIVALNAGAALYLAGIRGSLKEGTQLASETLLKGRAMMIMEGLRDVG